jgi:hypothetical protein
LYKLGRKDEAITAEKKALLITPEREKKNYSETLAKMEKREKTPGK